jgi:transcriptional regulator with XRE-family HTH domain
MLNTKTIGNKIAEARKKINISQAELAQRLFISSQAVGKWERGESMPDITTFNRLAEILEVDLNYFSESFSSTITDVAPVEPLDHQHGELPSGKPEKKPLWDMSGGSWVDADFSGLKNLQEKFSSSNMQRCLFIGSDMSGLLLKGNNVESCDFSRSEINSSHIQGSYLVNNVFKDCSLRETAFSGSYIKGCDFSGADFTGAVFKSGSLLNNTMANAVWKRTSFNAMQLADMVLDGTWEDCSFDNCAFSKLTFQNATLTNTFFKGSLKKIRFVDCRADNLTYAFLKNGKADLTGITVIAP